MALNERIKRMTKKLKGLKEDLIQKLHVTVVYF
jgi:hypothetical protein